jgi:hypothetical protein
MPSRLLLECPASPTFFVCAGLRVLANKPCWSPRPIPRRAAAGFEVCSGRALAGHGCGWAFRQAMQANAAGAERPLGDRNEVLVMGEAQHL